MQPRSRFTPAVAIALLAACGGTPHEAANVGSPAKPVVPQGARPLDPDLHREPPKPLLSIDWATVPLATDADANAVWKTIAPTGADWDAKLDEVPVASARPLAIAMLHGGNFTCMQPQHARDCAPQVFDVTSPSDTAGLDDPCLRRILALWSIAALEDDDVPTVLDALRAIVAIPPPESQLVAAALGALPETDHDHRMELLAIAWGAGQRDLVNGNVGPLDEAHMIDAARKLHIDGALEVLSAEAHRAVYLSAINDEAMASKARVQAISEVTAGDDPLAADARATLVTAVRSKDCSVAAAAARTLDLHGDHRFVPRRPKTRSPETMMRALCVLASYERLQHNDEISLLATYIPPKGLERVKVAFDALADVDLDGDGDAHTEHTIDLVSRDEAVVPEVEDMIRAFKHCTATSCASADRDYRFTFKSIGGELWLSRLELADRPSCPSR